MAFSVTSVWYRFSDFKLEIDFSSGALLSVTPSESRLS